MDTCVSIKYQVRRDLSPLKDLKASLLLNWVRAKQGFIQDFFLGGGTFVCGKVDEVLP